MLKWNVFSFSALLLFSTSALGDGYDKSRFIPPMAGTPEDVRFTLNKPMSKNLRNKFGAYIDQFSKSKNPDPSKYQWSHLSTPVSIFEIKLKEVPTDGQNYEVKWTSILPKVFYIKGQSALHNRGIHAAFLEYAACINTAYFKNDIAACAEVHAIIQLARECPDRNEAWVIEQQRVLAEFNSDFLGQVTGAARISAIPTTPTQFYSKYAIQDYKTNNAVIYTKRIFEYQRYIAEPFACSIAMKTWAEAGTQTGIFKQGYNFSEAQIKMIMFYNDETNVETAVAPTNFEMPQVTEPTKY